jgi:fumarate hydratase class I
MNAPVAAHPTPPYKHTPLFPLGKDDTPYRKIAADIAASGVRVERVMGEEVLVVPREALRALSEAAFTDINHLLRPAHLASLKAIVEDSEASPNDKFVAYEFLKNANISAGGVLPMCQDTGTAIIMGKKGRLIWSPGDDEAALAEGARDAYLKRNLRYSQLAPLSMFEEKNTRSNMPAQVEIYAESAGGEAEYKFLFIAKGGGSANKAFLFQATPSILTRERMLAFLKEKVLTLGTAACPPYHLAIVIGGTSAELTMKTVKLASCKYYDALPERGSEDGHAFRDRDMEREIQRMTQSLGVGAQFGGKYFCHDVRVIRLPRHGASLPIGLGVSCAADRQALAKINKHGVFLEELEHNPAKYLPDVDAAALGGELVKIDLTRPMKEILAQLRKHPIKTRLSLTGPMIVARDLAHAKLRERLERGEGLPDYFKNTRSVTPARQKRRRATPPARSAPPRPAVWIHSSTISRPPAAPWSCWRRAIARRWCAMPARSMAASILPRSAARRPISPSTASRRSNASNILSLAWKRSGASKWSTFRPSSSSTTKATISSKS